MLFSVRFVLCLTLAAAFTTSGCTPPIESGRVSSGSGVSANVTVSPDVTTSPNVTVSAASGQESTGAKMVANPLYNELDPVLFDSGWEDNNDSCMVCHIDFEHEEISSIHLEAGVTCMACHGDSEVHRADEYNIIRPDVLWGRSEISAFCEQCHQKHKHPGKVQAFLEEWENKRRPNGRWVLEDSVCTDCHGEHAIMLAEGVFK